MHPLLTPIQQIIRRHPRRLMGGLAALLLGTGVTAFGVAPLLPSESDLPPSRVLSEPVPVQFLGQQGAQPSPAFVLFRSDRTRRDDSVQSLLKRLGVQDSAAARFLANDDLSRQLLDGRGGRLVSVETDDDHNLLRLTARWLPSDSSTEFSRLTAEFHNGEWTSRLEHAPLTPAIRLGSGLIRTSLFAATDAARLPDSVASQLAETFSSEIDFRRDLRVGDRFSVVYEALEGDGEVLRYGRLLGAEFVNDGKAHQLVWFQAPGTKGDYYTLAGESMRRAFLASPLAFSRVSSGYGMRFHPISGNRKPHLGVDYAAPTGTPVRTVADGKVSFAGVKGGYGNMVIVQHSGNRFTGYAHLSRINVRTGQRVDQSDVIGLVGSTGASTGPHLHFEYLEGKQHRDPFSITRIAGGQPLSAGARQAFNAVASRMKEQIGFAGAMAQANAE